MLIQELIEDKLTTLNPLHLVVENESHNHHVPEGSESHFKVTIVSKEFESLRLIERHRMVNELLQNELAGPVHALALHTYTEADWSKRFGQTPMSPPCARGSSSA
ncbi:MAG: BolA/IbaG family iron-sulfur metabolism protein [Gammaproteobacteria bacterium]|nr:BolA/IbaG family iron-sulfur metabolism protein [Gammaproteobacteria bacterium]